MSVAHPTDCVFQPDLYLFGDLEVPLIIILCLLWLRSLNIKSLNYFLILVGEGVLLLGWAIVINWVHLLFRLPLP